MSDNTRPPQAGRDKEEHRLKLPIITVAIVACMSILIWRYMHIFSALCEAPKIDLEEWWGPYPVDMESDESVQPYTIEFPVVIANDLKERLLHRRPFTPPLENSSLKNGFNTDFLKRVLDFWQDNYNIAERERFLNKYEHFMTKIQGLNIHFMHVRPKVTSNVAVVPILLIHSWPSSIREFYEMIPLLSTQQKGRDFVFEVIVPSLPGFGFSQAPTREGMDRVKISVILHKLMQRIGYDKYYIQGGDFGQAMGSVMATVFPDNVLGFHSNMPVAAHNPSNTFITNMFGLNFLSRLFSTDDKRGKCPLRKYTHVLNENCGYSHSLISKPDTLGIALSESPAGLAAYLLEKFAPCNGIENQNESDGGLLKKFSLTQLLDNVMVYWMTNSFTTSVRTYNEYVNGTDEIDCLPTDVPTWGIKFKDGLFSPDCVLKYKFFNYLQTTVVEQSGHFPAMEHPQLLADDIYNAVTAFRQFHENKKEPQSNSKPEAKKTSKSEAMKTSEPEVKTSEPQAKKASEPEEEKTSIPEAKESVYDFKVKDINGNEVSLKRYRGKVLIIVNVASQCGYTNTHYTQLNELYEKYADRGLRILAFPCNQFGYQEPGTLKEILQFTQKRNVKFDVFEKIDVNGENTHPLWEFLKKIQGGSFGDFIKWNFSKFIIDRNGIPVERFGPNVDPLDLEPYLEKYW